ncbi:conjugative transfer signal peptidase TraF [Commensalibacter nepenthis]|uniref:Conjugative transfer signal peptidase TraF n=1 Tax=Commensalibacter nepenthis TaxID=3043872 RepID=A0ABT6QAQ7_9PROT|nr:conjugative transfer signal peptidase TraF [Commensalibacter sp. TBRC 10068]MDI2113879.1 conjugative transfer signal peptidase TraF [Commensalibacter sp. TBRC 10068]
MKIITSIAISILTLALLLKVGGFRINSTPSEPMGIWRSTNYANKGDLVEACIPPTATMIEARKRGYLLSGKCKGNLAPVIKRIVAIEGDSVSIELNGLSINGVLFSSNLALKDSDNRPLKPAFLGNYLLKKNEVFLASNYTDKSFDSRYFGVINKNNILHGMKAILVTNWKPKGY